MDYNSRVTFFQWIISILHLPEIFLQIKHILIQDLRGVMVSMLTSHAGDRGSIPGTSSFIILSLFALKCLISISVSCQSA